MINWDEIEQDLPSCINRFRSGVPFEHLVIDNFCDEKSLASALSSLSSPESNEVGKSRDFIFAKNKFEKSKFDLLAPEFEVLKRDLLSQRFSEFLSSLAGEQVFVDPEFHGGGLHQGGEGSFLDMHVDFNYHPINKSWFRNVNILIYMNKNWRAEYGGELKLIDGRSESAEEYKIDPLFNRAVIMFTRGYTLHGYDPISFPLGEYRRSIAAYGYSDHVEVGNVRSTVWYPERGGMFKKLVGKQMPFLIKWKSKLIGSGTRKNK